MSPISEFDVPKILSFGPISVRAGQDFNIQQNGESAIWFKVAGNQNSLCVKFDDKELKSFYKDSLITCNIPKEFYQRPGDHKIYLKDESNGLTSNIVIFSVI